MTAKFYLKKYKGQNNLEKEFVGSMYVTKNDLQHIKEVESDPDFIRWIEKDEHWTTILPEDISNWNNL